MTLHVKNGSTWSQVNDLYVKDVGLWKPVQYAYTRQNGTWVEYYAAEVVATIAGNVADRNVQSLFTAEDWASNKKKIVIINEGVVLNGNSYGLRTGTGRGSSLEIRNYGDIRGFAGTAGVGNSGSGSPGGHAVYVEQSGVTINNFGFIRGGGGGGGGGGRGGNGGSGSYNYTASEGPIYNGSSYMWVISTGRQFNRGATLFWGGQFWNGDSWTGAQSTTSYQEPSMGMYRYHRGALRADWSGSEQVGGSDGWTESWTTYVYEISRTWTASAGTTGGAGGAGGAGGVGQGWNANAAGGANGAGGAGGGTNAGTGGTGGRGGTGGTWGAAGAVGSTGNTGGSGNASGGTAGAGGGPGGAAGYAIFGVARTVNNTGTIQGAQV